MILHLTRDQLEWVNINHHEEFSRVDNVVMMLQSEIFYYKNEEVTIRATIKIIEYNNRQKNFEVAVHSYAHMHPDLIRMEFTDRKQLGEFMTIEEAKFAAQTHFNHHHHVNYNHPH